MSSRDHLGGVIHTYQGYDPKHFPSPTQPPPDLASPAMEHLLMFGGTRELTDEELARAVHLDPSQFAGLGPGLDALIAMLLERKRKILATYETDTVLGTAARRYRRQAERMTPPRRLARAFVNVVRTEQLHDLERLWYRVGDDRSPFARQLVSLVDHLGAKYQIEQMAARYDFTGRQGMTIPKALAVKEELDKIDELLQQLREASKSARIGIIDLEALAEFAEPGEIGKLDALRAQVADHLRQLAESQGLEASGDGYRLTPHAYRLFQGKVLERIFSNLQAARTGRHQGPIVGDGAVEMQRTRPYEFGDSVANLDLVGSLTNAMVRSGPGLPIRLRADDLEVHHTRNSPKCATVVVMDMSGSMRHAGQYIHAKRMGIALDGLIRREYPGDYLRFVEMYTFAKPRHLSEVAALLPRIPTIRDSVVRLKADMSDERISEHQIHPHFTNIQHGLQTARRLLATQDTPNREVILITDGLPTAHFEGEMLYMLYPPDPRTEQATMREGRLCQREGITINVFLVPGWSQSREDIRFAHRLAESTKGRVFFTAGTDLDRYVVWDYVQRQRTVIA